MGAVDLFDHSEIYYCTLSRQTVVEFLAAIRNTFYNFVRFWVKIGRMLKKSAIIDGKYFFLTRLLELGAR